MTTNFHIYPTTITNESRMMKETTSIVALGLADSIEMVGIRKGNLARKQELDSKRSITRLPIFSSRISGKIGRVLFYAEAYVRYFFFLATKKISILNCHSLMLLPVAVAIVKLKRAKLIYDTHELETERTGLEGIEKRVSKYIERNLINYCNSVITVGPEITNWYKKTYGIDYVYTVRNIPSSTLHDTEKSNILRDTFNIQANQILFVYQGYFISGRGIEILLDAFKELAPTYQIVFMGEGTLEPKIKQAATEYSNIHLQPTVPYSEILRYTSSCDIGISLFENTCLSHYYVLPNKVFEYIKSHLPILVSDFPEMQNLVQTYSCGWTVLPSKENVITCISNINKEQVLKAKQLAIKASTQLDWKNEEQDLYKALV